MCKGCQELLPSLCPPGGEDAAQHLPLPEPNSCQPIAHGVFCIAPANHTPPVAADLSTYIINSKPQLPQDVVTSVPQPQQNVVTAEPQHPTSCCHSSSRASKQVQRTNCATTDGFSDRSLPALKLSMEDWTQSRVSEQLQQARI